MIWMFIDALLFLRRFSGGKFFQGPCKNLDQFLVVLFAKVVGSSDLGVGQRIASARVDDSNSEGVSRKNHTGVEHQDPQRLLSAALTLTRGVHENERVNVVVLIEQQHLI